MIDPSKTRPWRRRRCASVLDQSLHGRVTQQQSHTSNMVTTSRDRMRLLRTRRKDDLVVLPLLIPLTDATEMLIDLGVLTTDDPSREQLVEALSQYLYSEVTRHQKA